MGEANNLKFLSFSSVVDPSFWHKLCQIKLEEDKLEEKEWVIHGFYLHPSICSITTDCTSFNENQESQFGKTQYSTVQYLCQNHLKYSTQFLNCKGHLINFNTSNKFKECNKSDLLYKVGQYIREDIQNGKALQNPQLLLQFVLITYVNLKNYDFIYWFGFPALSSILFRPTGDPQMLEEKFSTSQVEQILKSHENLSCNDKGIFGVEIDGDNAKCIPLNVYLEKRNDGSVADVYLCFLDPSSEDKTPGWPLRNLLLLIKHYSNNNNPVNIICLRIGAPFKTSFILTGVIEGDPNENKWIGWEKNKRGKFGPKSVNLQNDLDPVRLCDASADLNLKLMKWRLVPDLDLDIIKSQKCLLLGAGTLGCSVARNLLGWGVRHITFVDYGNVSFSNPVRQSLFKLSDCNLGSGAKLKAHAAAQALKDILPTVESKGVVLEIPMPGHSTANIDSATELHDLILNHDVVFLLTDSRESRWLPTVISTAHNKVGITAALGYDTYLVMRHGVKKEDNSKLGCYFCNDITAPGNSMEDRTLDQQCTVTRPGVSSMAAALAVELFVSLLQHKEGGKAATSEETVLGTLPHSVRGFLAQYNHILPVTSSFSQCIACSPVVIDNYMKDREVFLKKVFDSAKFLEELTGLTELHRMSETLEDLELSDENEEDSSKEME